jgi:hypothetical protein
MKKEILVPKKTVVPNRTWFKASLTPVALGLFTDAFYPDPKKRTGTQYVFFADEQITPTLKKVIVASKISESGLRILTQELAQRCLVPTSKATKAEMLQLNQLSAGLKL